MIEAMGSLRDLPGRPRYLVVGRTHPKVLADDGEAYRDARMEQARRSGVADSVSFDARYWSVPMLTALVQSAAVVVLPDFRAFLAAAVDRDRQVEDDVVLRVRQLGLQLLQDLRGARSCREQMRSTSSSVLSCTSSCLNGRRETATAEVPKP